MQLVQKRMPRDYLHINNISFLVQDCIDLHVALNARLSREYRTLGAHLHDRFRSSYSPTYTNHFPKQRRSDGH